MLSTEKITQIRKEALTALREGTYNIDPGNLKKVSTSGECSYCVMGILVDVAEKNGIIPRWVPVYTEEYAQTVGYRCYALDRNLLWNETLTQLYDISCQEAINMMYIFDSKMVCQKSVDLRDELADMLEARWKIQS